MQTVEQTQHILKRKVLDEIIDGRGGADSAVCEVWRQGAYEQ